LATIFAVAGLIGAGPGTSSARADEDALYRAQAIVTGQVEPERSRGFALCLADVLVKLSGDPALSGDPRLPALAARAGEFVAGFRYHDRMEGIPIHDEQGTRDRPYDLTVTFDHAKIDGLLHDLGRAPWTGERPTLALLVGFALGGRTRILSRDSDEDFAERLAIEEAGARRGMTLVLPSTALLASLGLTYESLPSAPPAPIDQAVRDAGGDLPLIGRLSFSDGTLDWQVDWQLTRQGATHRWQTRSENFDAAFRNGIEGAERILSGHGEP
jgi:hypothetical protein